MQPFSLHVAFVVFARAVSPILILSSWILMRGPTLAADGAAAVPITSVVELYTSQGCSSCPPADALFTSYMNKTGVLALSFNVDIWDNLGWKDTLASPQFTKRQRSYALSRGDGQIYTPQTVVNGMVHAVGSDRAGINSAIKTTTADAKCMRVALGVAANADGVDVSAPSIAGALRNGVDTTLWLVKLTPEVSVIIPRGENSGHTVSYHNVVRDLTAVDHWSGIAGMTKVNRAALTGCKPRTCAFLLQQGGTGTMLGAAWVPGLSGT